VSSLTPVKNRPMTVFSTVIVSISLPRLDWIASMVSLRMSPASDAGFIMYNLLFASVITIGINVSVNRGPPEKC